VGEESRSSSVWNMRLGVRVLDTVRIVRRYRDSILPRYKANTKCI